jgi:hypothetical protein
VKLIAESTDRIVTLNGVPARVWEGTTESGVACFLFVTRIAVHKDEDASQFEAELQEQRPPSAESGGETFFVTDGHHGDGGTH